MSIPPPHTRPSNLRELHTLMKKTHASDEQYKGFKERIRTCARNHLDLPKAHTEQQKAKWARFVQQVLRAEKRLRLYENHWPIVLYYDLYSKHYKGPPCRQGTEIIVIESSRESSPHGGGPVQESPPSQNDEHQDREVEVLRNLIVERPKTPTYTIPEYYAKYLQSPASKLRQASSKYAGLADFQSTDIPTSDVTTAFCHFCGPPTEVGVFLNHKLSKFVNDQSLLKVLASFGVCFDQHLQILLRFNSATRYEFVNLLPLQTINPSAISELLRSLNHYSLNRSDACSVEQVPCPSCAVESDMVNNMDFPHELQKYMRLNEDDDVFNDLMHTMEEQAREFFQVFNPKIEHMRATVRRIIKASPFHFERYSNYWPIRLYLKHWQICMEYTTPQYSAKEELAAFILIFQQMSHNGTSRTVPFRLKRSENEGVEQIPCTIHPPISLAGCSRNMRTFLHSYGMAELFPCLVHLGIYTDDDFDAFLLLDQRTRIQLLVKVQLSELQKFMLHIMFN